MCIKKAVGCSNLIGIVDDRYPFQINTWGIGALTSHVKGLVQKGRVCGSKGIMP